MRHSACKGTIIAKVGFVCSGLKLIPPVVSNNGYSTRYFHQTLIWTLGGSWFDDWSNSPVIAAKQKTAVQKQKCQQRQDEIHRSRDTIWGALADHVLLRRLMRSHPADTTSGCSIGYGVLDTWYSVRERAISRTGTNKNHDGQDSHVYSCGHVLESPYLTGSIVRM